MEIMDNQIDVLLARMTLEEKIGQLMQKNAEHPDLGKLIRKGKCGLIFNQVDPEKVSLLHQSAIEESCLRIPLNIGPDVFHGFRMIMPIPPGQAATGNHDLLITSTT
jgi:beta-glucosidase